MKVYKIWSHWNFGDGVVFKTKEAAMKFLHENPAIFAVLGDEIELALEFGAVVIEEWELIDG